MRLVWIRHGQTEGNLKKQYIGSTDEGLCLLGKRELIKKEFPPIERLFISPMRRCRETAAIIYPHHPYQIIEAFKERDFGCYEGKSYEDLKADQAYRGWLQSSGKLPFPKGEDLISFKARCILGFEQAAAGCKTDETVGLIVHGGTIMAVFEAYVTPKKNFYAYQVKNGNGYMVEYDEKNKQFMILQEIG